MTKITIKQIQNLEEKALDSVDEANSLETAKKLKVKFLGRKSKLTNILRSIKDVPKEKRKEFGKAANTTQQKIKNKIQQKITDLEERQEVEEGRYFDITRPGKDKKLGKIHPITQIRWKTEDIFQKMGFQLVEPYEVDDDSNIFESVNIPAGHPARDIWDTFWTEDGFIPIPHTSSMQNRILKSNKPPIRAISIGKVFRNETTDPRHEHTLYQCEGIYVDKGISLSNMIGTLKEFFIALFEKEVEVRVIPDYFPFVEPGNGMELTCFICDGKGCRVCKDTGWLEIMGAGMIHPNVLKMGGIDPEVYSGFAWGFGLDRLVMLKYAIEDIRHFHSGDLRFINQF